MNSAHLESGATPASAVTSTTAASKSRAPRHRTNNGLITMDDRKARVGERHTVGIREVEDTGQSADFGLLVLPAFSMPGSLPSAFKYLILFNSCLSCV